MLSELYQSYYNGNLDYVDLAASIIEFKGEISFDSSLLNDIKTPISHDKITSFTSGSTTGLFKEYNFSDSRIKSLIELGSKQPHGEAFVMQLSIDRSNTVSVLSEKGFDNFHYYFTYSNLNKLKIELLMQDLENLLKLNPKIILWTSDKNNILYLMSDNKFIDFLIENKDSISIINTGIPAFFKKKKLLENGFHINDNMIDWPSGLNFYCCRYNKKHILPIFYMNDGYSINLLNSSARKLEKKSDRFNFAPIGICECGKTHYEIDFISHISTIPMVNGEVFYDIELVELLKGKYHNMQFIQKVNVMTVYYIGDLLDFDKKLIESKIDKDVVFEFGVFTVNRKEPVFYKMASNIFM